MFPIENRSVPGRSSLEEEIESLSKLAMLDGTWTEPSESREGLNAETRDVELPPVFPR